MPRLLRLLIVAQRSWSQVNYFPRISHAGNPWRAKFMNSNCECTHQRCRCTFPNSDHGDLQRNFVSRSRTEAPVMVPRLTTTHRVDFVVAYLRQNPVKQLRLRRTSANAVVPAGSVPPQIERKARLLLIALVLSTGFLFVRGIFRTIELLDGWRGKLATDVC